MKSFKSKAGFLSPVNLACVTLQLLTLSTGFIMAQISMGGKILSTVLSVPNVIELTAREE